MLRTAQLLPSRDFDTGLRHRAFPPDAASLLPGPLAVTRTGLAPAGNDELAMSVHHYGVTSIYWAHGWLPVTRTRRSSQDPVKRPSRLPQMHSDLLLRFPLSREGVGVDPRVYPRG